MRIAAALVALLAAVVLGQPQPDTLERIRAAKTPADLVAAVEDLRRPRGVSMHTATWDNGVATTGGMVVTFDRDTATYDHDGAHEGDAVAKAADAPRYGHPVTVYGPPTLETVDAAAGGWRPYAAGLDAAGLPVAVVNYRATPTLKVYRDGAVASVLSSTTLLGGANKPATNLGDILNGQGDEEADYTHDPRGAVCLPGLILLNCCTHKYNGTGDRTSSANYTIDGVSLVYSTDNGSTWGLAWRSGTINGTTPPNDYGAEWSITAADHDRDGTADDYWVTVASYASGGDRGADTFVCRVTGGAGSWSIGNAHQFAHADGSGTDTHVHYSVCLEDPNNAAGLKLLCEIGDTSTDNRTEEYLCATKAGYLTGGSAVSGATNVVDGGSSWSGPTQINGKTGAGAANEWMASQTISYAPGPSGGFYAGADEGLGGPVFYATVPATDGERVNWQNAHAIPGTTGASTEHNWRCFGLNAWELDAANPAVAAFVSPGTSWVTGSHDAGRILYKPRDATEFGVVYAPQDEASLGSQLRPVLGPAGYIWMGTGNSQGLRRFPLPRNQRSGQAVYAGPGGTNHALATPVQQNPPGSGNTVTIGAETPPATPPTDAAAMHFTAGTSAVGLGVWRITDNAIDKAHSTLTVQVLVYQDTDAADSDADCYFRARFYTIEGTASVATGYIGPDRIETRGHFHLLTYVLENGPAGDWDLTGVADADGLRILMQMQTSGATVHPGEWWQWFVGVYEDAAAPPAYLVPPATTGDAESLELSGFTCGASWTALVVGQLGGDTGRDTKHPTADTFREVVTLWEDADTYIEVSTDADDQVKLYTTDGAAHDTATVTALPKMLRGDPFVLAVAFDGTDYTYALSVSGAAVQTGTIASASAPVSPTKILLGQDDDGTNREPTRWLHARVYDGAAVGDLSGLVTSLGVASSSGPIHRTRTGTDTGS